MKTAVKISDSNIPDFRIIIGSESSKSCDGVVMLLKSWVKGSRGEWYLVFQAGLFLLLAFGPRGSRWLPAWGPTNGLISTLSGGILFLAGTMLAATGSLNLGKNLTPLPDPKENATLIVSGVFRFVRHPIYSGITFMAIGWGLWLQSGPTLGYALLIFVFFDIKLRREERLLEIKFPEYSDYKKNVRKLIPFVY